MKYYTVYKTTNLINYKVYIGCHITDNPFDDYLGSGVKLLKAINKYGRKNFYKDIIAICDSREEMMEIEKQLVSPTFLTYFSTYNLRTGGDGGFNYINSSGLSGSRKGGLNTFAKMTIDEEFKRKFRENRLLNLKPAFKGKKHSKASKIKMSEHKKGMYVGEKNPSFGTMWITNGIKDKKIKKLETIPIGFRKGRVQGVDRSTPDLHSGRSGAVPDGSTILK